MVLSCREASGIVKAKVIGWVASIAQHSFQRDALDLQEARSAERYFKAWIAVG